MSISTPGTTQTTGTNSTTQTNSTNSSSSSLPINENQFLQMLMTELQNQNPMDPNSSDPMSFVTELAQFTSVEQETDTAQNTSTLATGQSTSAALQMIGSTVNYTDPTSGATDTGTVQSVEITSSGPTLTVNGTSGIAPSSVTEVS
ncbi:MAG TPA: flagellar hook capping FlgD N-terminal domain-containing protein [Solirubrobacteraceae bacterium]|nr:flagellar hook capping FlgD N-terminal domain-containing protein [Solirubrobacteraceae bacterium]